MDLETFSIDICDEPPSAVVLRLAGEFDIVSEPALQEALDGLCHRSGCPLLVDVSEAQFMGVGSLRRIVLAGRGFASTEFRSPAPIVEKVLRILGFIDGTVGIEGGTLRQLPPSRSMRSLLRGASTSRNGTRAKTSGLRRRHHDNPQTHEEP